MFFGLQSCPSSGHSKRRVGQ